MASCEKCWADSYTYTYGTGESRIECYQRLVRERNCTPEEQAGEDAGVCPKCKRKSVHQFTGDCMNCGLTKEQIKWFHKDKDEIIKMLTDILYTHTDQTVMVINEVDYENVVNDIIEML